MEEKEMNIEETEVKEEKEIDSLKKNRELIFFYVTFLYLYKLRELSCA